MIKTCERGRQEHPVCGDRGSFMTGTMFFNMLLNIGLLVLLATLLTNMASVRKLFRGENSTIIQKMALAVIFGAISIVSTYTGTKTGGAIVNTRVIGVLTAGIMGGPFVGMMTALIAGAHRFLFDIGGFTAASCAVSTLVEGVLGSLVYKKYKAGEMDSVDLFFLTAEAEILQMVIILMISKPLGAAMELVGKIAVPMIVMNSVGMVLFFKTFDMVYMREDSLFAERMRLSMGIADKSLVYLRKGFGKRENMEAVTDIIFGEIPCQAVIITDEKEVLAVSSLIDDSRFRREKFLEHLTGPAKGMKAECIWEEDLDEEIRPLFHSLVTVTVPVMTGDEKIGSLSIVVKKRRRVERSIGDFLEELAKMFSTQLGVYNVEYQKKLRKKAEFKALQSQVNPHFLYNALNTISCICDEDAGKASDLILTLASYYRQTLENDQYMLDIDTEINHVRTYLEIEKARFEEKLRVERSSAFSEAPASSALFLSFVSVFSVSLSISASVSADDASSAVVSSSKTFPSVSGRAVSSVSSRLSSSEPPCVSANATIAFLPPPWKSTAVNGITAISVAPIVRIAAFRCIFFVTPVKSDFTN